MNRETLGLYLRTVRHLPPHQLAHRVRLRAQRAFYRARPEGLEERWAAAGSADGTGSWPPTFVPLDLQVAHPPPAATAHGRGLISAVGEQHDVFAESWAAPERSQLFRYHMHYFEWAWPLAVSGTTEDRHDFEQLWRSWQTATVPGHWDEWSPYVVALRSWVLCGVFESLVRGSAIEDDVLRNLRASLTYLCRNLELDVGGNHLMKDLKAAIGLCILFADSDRLESLLDRLEGQVVVQVLPDGGHFELSPSYHAQVLIDLHDLSDLLTAVHGQAPAWLTEPVQRMGEWLNTMSYPDGTLPLIGDCSPPPAGLLGALRRRHPSFEPLPVAHLTSTGHVVFRPQPEAMVVADFGHTCPPSLPAHGQADWGTFEVWVSGDRVVVDPGVSSYVGPRRQLERSSAAHNTAVVDGKNDSEVWGSFRVAALSRVSPPEISISSDGATATARMEPFHGLAAKPGGQRGTIERSITVTASHIQIEDCVNGEARSGLTVSERHHLDAVFCSDSVEVSETTVANGFGDLRNAFRAETAFTGDKPCVWTIDLTKLVAEDSTLHHASTSTPHR